MIIVVVIVVVRRLLLLVGELLLFLAIAVFVPVVIDIAVDFVRVSSEKLIPCKRLKHSFIRCLFAFYHSCPQYTLSIDRFSTNRLRF